jgi:hypothetical protein
MGGRRLDQAVVDGRVRVERGIRVLKDHLHPAPRVAIENDLPGVWLDQAKDQPGGGGLATSGLADDPDRLAGVHSKRHVVDS